MTCTPINQRVDGSSPSIVLLFSNEYMMDDLDEVDVRC
jgi:hypothetical protein